MKVDGMVGYGYVSLFRFRVTALEKARPVFSPDDRGEPCPFDLIVESLACVYVQYPNHVPVGAAILHCICHALTVVRYRPFGKGSRPVQLLGSPHNQG